MISLQQHSQRRTQTSLDSVHTPSDEGTLSLSSPQDLLWISVGGLASGTQEQEKAVVKNHNYKHFADKMDIKRGRTRAALWGGFAFDPLRSCCH